MLEDTTKKIKLKNKKQALSIIAAIGKNRELGKNNKLLWHIPEDLKRFKTLTIGHPVIMGRKTFESIGRTLPQRTNIVITRNKNYLPAFSVKENKQTKLIVVHSLSRGIKKAREEKTGEIFIIGGGEIYKQAIAIADKLYLTIVDKSLTADTFFPEYKKIFKKVISRQQSTSSNYRYLFLELVKIFTSENKS